MELLGVSGLVEEAMAELEGMSEEETIVADYRIYFSLIRNALAHGRIGLASRAMQMMNEVGCNPQASALKLLWDSLIKVRHYTYVLSKVLKNGHSSEAYDDDDDHDDDDDDDAIRTQGGHSKAALELLDGIGEKSMSVGALQNTRLRLLLNCGDEAGAMRQVC